MSIKNSLTSGAVAVTFLLCALPALAAHETRDLREADIASAPGSGLLVVVRNQLDTRADLSIGVKNIFSREPGRQEQEEVDRLSLESRWIQYGESAAFHVDDATLRQLYRLGIKNGRPLSGHVTVVAQERSSAWPIYWPIWGHTETQISGNTLFVEITSGGSISYSGRVYSGARHDARVAAAPRVQEMDRGFDWQQDARQRRGHEDVRRCIRCYEAAACNPITCTICSPLLVIGWPFYMVLKMGDSAHRHAD